MASKKKTPPPAKPAPMTQASFRVEQNTHDSAGAIASRLGLGVTRSFVLRAALNIGMLALNSKKSDRALAETVKEATQC